MSPQPTRGNQQTGEVVEVTRLGRCGTQSGAAQFRLGMMRIRMGRRWSGWGRDEEKEIWWIVRWGEGR